MSMSIGLAEARALVAAAQRKAIEIGKPVTIAVVDTGGFSIVSERMDGARPLTPSIAMAKAYTAAVMQRPTRMLKGWCDSQPEFFAQVSRMGITRSWRPMAGSRSRRTATFSAASVWLGAPARTIR
jgi:uncharacterized protein GlcG (DUF336 family)